jgi:hypothetical protein
MDMQLFSIKRTMVTLGAVAALAVGTGVIPHMTNHTSTAQAAELSQRGGGHGGGGGGHQGGGGHNGGGHNGGGHNGGGHMGGQGGHNGGGHGGFSGRNFRSSHGFSHTYWGWGLHRSYPQYYVAYYYEPVSVCETYYFADDEGAWYCFVGY